MTSKIRNALQVPRKKALVLDTGNYEVHRDIKLDYTNLARQVSATGELTFGLIPKAKMVSFPEEN